MKKSKDFYTLRGYQMLNKDKKKLTTSMEDYLEMIYRVCTKEGYIRINQLADKLNVQPSSSTKIVKKLRDFKLVDYQEYGIIKLTNKGEEVGEFLLRRHEIVEQLLKNLDIENTLLKDTERVEHFLSPKTLTNIYILNEFFKNHSNVLELYKKFKKEFTNKNL